MENKFQHSISTFAFSLIFPFQPSIDNQTINLELVIGTRSITKFEMLPSTALVITLSPALNYLILILRWLLNLPNMRISWTDFSSWILTIYSQDKGLRFRFLHLPKYQKGLEKILWDFSLVFCEASLSLSSPFLSHCRDQNCITLI